MKLKKIKNKKIKKNLEFLKKVSSTNELVFNYQNFDALKNLLDGKTNEHTSMLNNFCGFAINQIRLKVVKA